MATKKETMSAKAAEENPAVKRGRKPRLDENGEEKKCFICGATKNLVRTECCGKWICDDEDKYVVFSYARNSCHRNHRGTGRTGTTGRRCRTRRSSNRRNAISAARSSISPRADIPPARMDMPAQTVLISSSDAKVMPFQNLALRA